MNHMPALTDEQKQWVMSNYECMTLLNLSEEFSKLFRPISYSGMRNAVLRLRRKNGEDLPPKTCRVTVEEEKWLLENWDKYKTWREVATEFSRLFRKASIETVTQMMRIRGCVKRTPSSLKYTQEEKTWLFEKLKQKLPHKDIVSEFNSIFTIKTGRVLNSTNLSKFAESNNLTYGKRGNKSIAARGGRVPKNRAVLGTESRNSKGFIVVKVDNKPKNTQYNWKLKKVIEWEKFNNKTLPKGYVIVCLDRNEDNFSQENLFMVSKKAAQSLYSLANWNPSVNDMGIEWTKTFLLASELGVVLRENGVIV